MLQRHVLILEDGHGGVHSPEPELAVKRLFARHRVEDDFSVSARCGHQPGDDLLSKAGSLVAGQNSHIADVRAIRSIGERSSDTDQPPFVVGKATEHAVGENRLEPGRALVAERRRQVERGQLVPIQGVK
ncbi:hypothetical protein D9M69_695750 [compost metagenome]